ncbi:hypothetical protein RMATCC62417_13798 [Rhizopus microsporus]|nr:hypothetical protein RMATCC62417_13798 [Rhizopus microsporus]
METARVASRSDFVDKITRNLKVIEENTRVMRPTTEGREGSEDDTVNITTTLTLGLYHCIKNQHKRKVRHFLSQFPFLAKPFLDDSPPSYLLWQYKSYPMLTIP